MTPKTIMVIAGEASGDALAAELVTALREELAAVEARPSPDLQPLHTSLAPRFFGAGGPRMAAAGVELAFDLTAHAVVGLVEVLKNYGKFRRLFRELLALAIERQPHVIVCVDFSGFNLRFAEAIRDYVRRERGTFANWRPLIVQYVSPQVWASRPGRARKLERNVDLLLSIFPFEKDWYATHAPNLRVEFVGHPMVDRFAHVARPPAGEITGALRHPESPLVLLLPGSRADELRRHLPVMIEAVRRLQSTRSITPRMVLPNEELAERARPLLAGSSGIEVTVGNLAESLAEADLAIASTGTVTMECAWFGVPTVALYKTSWSTYEIGRRLIRVGWLAMPNILLGQPVFPEFIQHAATPENLARAGHELLSDPARRREVQTKLARIAASLGPPGASRRAAEAVVRLLMSREPRFPLRAALTPA